jgi:membrane-associated phospholipid phosphatase
VIAGTFTISLFDENIRRIFLRNQGQVGDRFSEIGEIYGEPISVLLLTGGIYIFGITLDNEWARKTAIIMTSSLLPAGMIQTVAKVSAGRSRPYLEFGQAHFEPFRRDEDYYSFVSGHTLVAISTSLVLAKQIQNSFVKGFLYGLGSIGALSRLYRDEHWFSDVLLGAALAISSVNTADEWITDNRKFVRRQVSWYMLPHRKGFSLTVTW